MIFVDNIVPKSLNLKRRDHRSLLILGWSHCRQMLVWRHYWGQSRCECRLPIRHSLSITMAANFQSFSTLPASSSSLILSVITYTNNTKYFYNLDNILQMLVPTLISLRMRLSSLCMGWVGTVFSSDTGGWGSEMLGWCGWTTTVLTMHSGHNSSLILLWIVCLQSATLLSSWAALELQSRGKSSFLET